MKPAIRESFCSYLFAVVCDWGQDSAKSLDTHGDIQQVTGEEEVVVMSKQRHHRVPTEIKESLWKDTVEYIIL